MDALEPREMADVSVEMVSPQDPGIYQGQWRMSTATGQFFGGERLSDAVWSCLLFLILYFNIYSGNSLIQLVES